MRHDLKNQKSVRECQHQLTTEQSRCADELLVLEEKQLAGDFSAETARKINLARYHLEVINNRLNGNFTNDYRNELECKICK